jgi:beta-lactamase regulating signal transducer with metallopeptidase domain/WD40 repeat protein
MNELAAVLASVFAIINFPSWEIVIKSTIVIALTTLACTLLRWQSAALRHRVWVCGLAASLVVPMACVLLPQLRLPLLPSTLDASRLVTTQDSRPPSPMRTAASSLPGSAGEITTNSVSLRAELDTKSSTAISADAPQTIRRIEEFASAFAGNPGLERVFLLCWLLGTMISSTLLLISLARQSIWLRQLRKIEDDDWVNSVTTAASILGLQRPIVALESDAACIPTAAGLLAPRLVVPSNWRSWSLTQRRCILLHELAHVKRCDISTQLVGRLALLAYWFNPLVWHAVRQLRVERELASDDCVLLAGQTASDYAEELLRTLRFYRPIRSQVGVAMAQSARLDHRVLAILDPERRRDPVGPRFAIILPCVVGIVCGVLGGVTLTTHSAIANPPTEYQIAVSAENANRVWKENYTVEYPGTLPVSVAFSADGKTLLTGDTGGEIMALIFAGDEPRWRWKSKVEGSHATVAFSADQKKVYATTKHGVRIVDAASGKEEARIEVNDSNPTAIGVFPNKKIAENVTRSQIVFGNPRGYFVKSWVEGNLADTIGTIKTSTVARGGKPVDEAAVPLAVDPSGRIAIMSGPIDATGEVGAVKGKNVLWAYVCGNYEKGSPGNRVLVGHTATVVSAAWAKERATAVTGDAAGRVIVWDAKTMQETRRVEPGGRIAALAISNDGTRTAAYVLRGHGEVYVWETAKPIGTIKPIHTELGDFGGPTAFASLSFSPDGKQLAGCAIDKRWLDNLGKLIGKVRVWELSAEPKAQLPPKQVYIKQLPKGGSINFVVLNNDSILTPATEEGAVDFRSINDGAIQARIVLGKFTIGGMKLASDRKWFALEQHAPTNQSGAGVPAENFEVAVYESTLHKGNATIPSCRQLLDVAADGKVVAVVREQRIELWDIAATMKLKAAPFQHTRIDAASFSPDGKLLALSDRNELVLWRWEENLHERIDLGRCVGSLTFSPDGKFLAEGPTPRENIQIRDVETRKVVQTLANGAKLDMNVPRMAYSQGGRVLIACDNITSVRGMAVPHRINLWDMADGSLAHQLSIPAGSPQNLDVSPNGRNLVAMIEDNDGVKLSVWRLDGENAVTEAGPTPPAAVRPR